MQAEVSAGIYKCRCCLIEGKHENFGNRHYVMFREYLNLILTQDPHVTQMICSVCVGFLQEVQNFREIVKSSQKQLLNAVDVNQPSGAVFVAALQFESNINEDNAVKVEEDTSYYLDPQVVLAENIPAAVDHNDASPLVKTELKKSPEYNTGCENFQDFEYDVNDTEITKISKCKRKRSDCKTKHENKYDSESDTPISEIKKKKSRLKKKKEKEPVTSTSQSKKHSFLDNNKVRSNIILILKHSTLLPFRNNFKSSFKCFYCDKLYIPFKELKQHIETEHNDVSETAISKIVRSVQNLIVTADISCTKCRLCDEEFKSIENLVEHLCNAHKKVYYETNRKPSHGILGVDLSTDTLKCHVCNKDFAFFKNLSVHMNEHYASFVCYICGKKFLSEHRYNCHIFKAHADKETKCKHCGKIFSTEPSMAYHVRKEHLKRMIKCLQCPETFPIGQYVKRWNHMAQAHGFKKPVFKCETCGRQYANSGSLAAHKRYTHKRTKEHKCEICGYITVHKTVMEKHMDVHNGVKNYECEFCKKKFGKPYTLKLHLKIHLNDKKFVCSLCDAAFIQKNSLKSHLKSKHPDSGIDISKL